MLFFINTDNILQRLSGNVGARLETVSQRGGGVSLLGDVQKLSGRGPGQPALGGSA